MDLRVKVLTDNGIAVIKLSYNYSNENFCNRVESYIYFDVSQFRPPGSKQNKKIFYNTVFIILFISSFICH